MELLGIALSIPVALVTSALYCLFLGRVVVRRKGVSRWLRLISCIVLAVFAVELLLLLTLRSVRSRGVFGPGFYIVQAVLFFVATPALANLLMLQSRRRLICKWYVASVLGTAFAFFLVLLQYSVSESLYRIDGENGPYSEVITRSAPF